MATATETGAGTRPRMGDDADRESTRRAAVRQSFNASGETAGGCGTPPAGATSYTYDDNGQRTGAGSDSFGYDATGAMVSASQGGSSYNYAVDGPDLRVIANDDVAAPVERLELEGDYDVDEPDLADRYREGKVWA